VFRDGKRIEVEVKLGELPGTPGAVAGGAAPAAGKARLGVELADVTDELRQRLGLDSAARGAVIMQVEPDSPAARAGLEPGDLIDQVGGEDVKNAADTSARLGKADSGAPLRLRVVREGRGRFVMVPPRSDGEGR
jgi:serine protease Do